jgi:hypothetical protein
MRIGGPLRLQGHTPATTPVNTDHFLAGSGHLAAHVAAPDLPVRMGLPVGIPFVAVGSCQAGFYFGVRHAPFRRATRVAASTAARSLVSFTGRACLPLN